MASYETMRIFAQNLNRLLDQKDITQLALATQMSVAASTVSSWCNAEKMPRMDKIERIADFFGVPKSQLIEPYTEQHDILDEIDVAFYGDYKELTEENKATLRDMARIMRERQANK